MNQVSKDVFTGVRVVGRGADDFDLHRRALALGLDALGGLNLFKKTKKTTKK